MTNKRFATAEEFAKFKVHVRNQYQPLGSVDDRLDNALATVIQNTKDFEHDAASSQRFLFVTGPSGSGKTYTLKRKIAAIPEFQRFIDETGKRQVPFISYRAPKQFNPKEMLIKIAQQLGIPSRGSENHLRDVLEEQIPFHGLKYIHIDEAQHGIRANTNTKIIAFQDALKAITSMDHWPLHIILSGVSKLDDLRTTDDQIERRSEAVDLPHLTMPDDIETLRRAIVKVIFEHCDLEIAPELDVSELGERLSFACNGAWGYMIETVQNACYLAIENNRTQVKMDHFAHNYRKKSACRATDNIFSVASPFWQHIRRPKLELGL